MVFKIVLHKNMQLFCEMVKYLNEFGDKTEILLEKEALLLNNIKFKDDGETEDYLIQIVLTREFFDEYLYQAFEKHICMQLDTNEFNQVVSEAYGPDTEVTFFPQLNTNAIGVSIKTRGSRREKNITILDDKSEIPKLDDLKVSSKFVINENNKVIFQDLTRFFKSQGVDSVFKFQYKEGLVEIAEETGILRLKLGNVNYVITTYVNSNE